MSQENIKNIIEAALMVSEKPLDVKKMLSLFGKAQNLQPERNDIHVAIESLQKDYEDHGIELVEVASGFHFQVRADYATWVNHLFDERPPRYSRALLETLAIIAYRQPITRAEIEKMRGVNVSGSTVKTLQEREWVKVVGHRDVPGKPELLATTKNFLDYFNLKELSDLPALADIQDIDSINPDLFTILEGEKSSLAGNIEGMDNAKNFVEEGHLESGEEQNHSESEAGSGSHADSEQVEFLVSDHEERTFTEVVTERRG